MDNYERQDNIFNKIDSVSSISSGQKEALKKILKLCLENIEHFNESNFIEALDRGDFRIVVDSNLSARGNYNVANNQLTLRQDFDENFESALHEFLHMASTPQKIKFTDKDNYEHSTGIMEYGREGGEKYEYARQLNEGVTEWLTQKCFGGKYRGSYFFETKIARILDTAIFDGKLTEAYFEGNSDKIFETLEKYNLDSDKFMKLVDLLDSNHNRNTQVIDIETLVIDLVEQKSITMLENSDDLKATQGDIKDMLSILNTELLTENGKILDERAKSLFPSDTLNNLGEVDLRFKQSLNAIHNKNTMLKEKAEAEKPKLSFKESLVVSEDEKTPISSSIVRKDKDISNDSHADIGDDDDFIH